MLDPNLPISKLDVFVLVTQLANLLPFLIYIVCIFWDLDGPYWVLEDFALDPKHRDVSTILIFLLVRTILLIPGFLETTRTLLYTALGYLCIVNYQKNIIQILAHQVKNQSHFYNYYTQLQILCNVLGPGFERASFIIITIAYFIFILTLWVCVSGFGELDNTVYLFFAVYAFFIILSTAVGLPLVASTGDVICNIPKIKVKYAKLVHCVFRFRCNKIFLKKAVSLRSIRFCYGSLCPIDRKFTRNLFDNVVQNLLSIILLFDMNGKRM